MQACNIINKSLCSYFISLTNLTLILMCSDLASFKKYFIFSLLYFIAIFSLSGCFTPRGFTACHLFLHYRSLIKLAKTCTCVYQFYDSFNTVKVMLDAV